MYFMSGKNRAFEMLMQGKPGFDRYENGCTEHEDCNTCHFYRPHWKYRFCVYAECPYEWQITESFIPALMRPTLPECAAFAAAPT